MVVQLSAPLTVKFPPRLRGEELERRRMGKFKLTDGSHHSDKVGCNTEPQTGIYLPLS